MSLGIQIELSFQETEANGEICIACHNEIKGTKYVLMLQVGDPLIYPPNATECEYCILCKLDFERDETGTK